MEMESQAAYLAVNDAQAAGMLLLGKMRPWRVGMEGARAQRVRDERSAAVATGERRADGCRAVAGLCRAHGIQRFCVLILYRR